MASAKSQRQSYIIYVCGPCNSTFTEIWTETENSNACQNGARTAMRFASDSDGSVCDIVDKTYNKDEDLLQPNTERTLQLPLNNQHNSIVVFLFLVDQLEYARAKGDTTTLADMTRRDNAHFEALLASCGSQYTDRMIPTVGVWVYNSLAMGGTELLAGLVERFQDIAEARGRDQLLTFFSNSARDKWSPTETVSRLAMHVKDFHIAAGET